MVGIRGGQFGLSLKLGNWHPSSRASCELKGQSSSLRWLLLRRRSKLYVCQRLCSGGQQVSVPYKPRACSGLCTCRGSAGVLLHSPLHAHRLSVSNIGHVHAPRSLVPRSLPPRAREDGEDLQRNRSMAQRGAIILVFYKTILREWYGISLPGGL